MTEFCVQNHSMFVVDDDAVGVVVVDGENIVTIVVVAVVVVYGQKIVTNYTIEFAAAAVAIAVVEY